MELYATTHPRFEHETASHRDLVLLCLELSVPRSDTVGLVTAIFLYSGHSNCYVERNIYLTIFIAQKSNTG